jgi:plasmid stabilization system protein ParE
MRRSNPVLGAEFVVDFQRAYRKLRQFPHVYSVRFANVRRLNLERFPYGIFYALTADYVLVLALLHASRDTETVLTDRRHSITPP